MSSLNPAIQHLLEYFDASHLKGPLAEVSQKFTPLAEFIAQDSSNPETSAALRKLLEAKDCAVRARLTELKRKEREDKEKASNV